MSFDPNDPRLTALALGELPEDERLAIEAEIADDPEAAAALAEIAATAQLLTEQFRLETAFAGNGLDAAQKRAIEDCLAASPAVAETPATVPFQHARPVPPAKPSDASAAVPPSRSMFQLRVAAGIVAIGTIAAGVAVVKLGVLDNDSQITTAAAPASPAAPAAPAFAGRVESPSLDAAPPAPKIASGYVDAASPAEKSARRMALGNEETLEERDRVPILDGAPGEDAPARRDLSGGGGGMMAGAPASNAPSLPPGGAGGPRPMFAPLPASEPVGSPSTRTAGGIMAGQGIQVRGLSGQQGQGKPGEPGQPGQQGQEGQSQLGEGITPQGDLTRSKVVQDPKLAFKGRETRKLFKREELSGGGRGSNSATDPSAAATAPEQFSLGTVGKPAEKAPVPAKPGVPALSKSDEKAPEHLFGGIPGGTAGQADQRNAGGKEMARKNSVYNYQSVETLARQLKDIPATAPVEVKLKADRLQRESKVMLDELKLAEAKPDQKSRDFDAKKQEVERFGKELEEVAQQVEEAKKVRVNDEEFGKVQDNPFQIVNAAPLSTFSVDVDTASYANVRRFLNQNSLPPKDAVRIEELINYFTYDDPAPMASSKEPFSLNVESAACPWSDRNRLVRVGLKGKALADDKRPASNLVFLVDVSGSMADLDKLPLLKAAMKLLVDNLTENDRVAIVTYANGVRVALPSTPCHRKPEILSVLEGLEAGGSTNGAGGIQRAYEIAVQNFIKGGTNRVLLATDGDFNVGVSDTNELVTMIQEKAKSGVFLSVLGFGQGNLKDEKMEQLADKGNGQYSYIDSIAEARKVLVKQMGGTIVTIAKDVKVQVEFNPSKVAAYRLIGYENRILQAQDFRDDKKDAGEIGAGLSVTALYEIVPVGADPNLANNVNLRFQNAQNRGGIGSPEWLHVAIRYKAPDGDVSTEFGKDLVDDGRPFARASNDLKFASAVAGFGMLLRDSPYKGRLTWPAVEELTLSGLGTDSGGYRHEFQDLVKKAATLSKP